MRTVCFHLVHHQKPSQIKFQVDGGVKTVLPVQIGTIPCLSNIVEKALNGHKKNDSVNATNGLSPTQHDLKIALDASTIQVIFYFQEGKEKFSLTMFDLLKKFLRGMLDKFKGGRCCNFGKKISDCGQ